METGNRDGEQLLGEILTRVEQDINSPGIRAARVLEYLRKHPQLTNWDVICFCVEYLGSQAIIPGMDWLQRPAMETCRAVYTAHYILFENVAWTDKQQIFTDRASEMTALDTTGGG